ncbi:MAG TPA: bifunctional alpha,alpha-trehalose-phosphate synthase (UDP-forming)/trehalose-phosphatase [Kofleriaceae bacterium]|nr:bifunctional alpha,alpha-trehalose-phosphate synthase (UDP-forming)/trehalose-phosphatase [Kofleriaceae bacterium]
MSDTHRQDPGAQLVVASARLPVSVSRGSGEAGSEWQISASPGGLATALRAVAGQRPFVWVGWPGAPVPADDRAEVTRRLEVEGGGVPVFLERKEVQGWYEELSNRVLWPLFHAMPPAIKVASARLPVSVSRGSGEAGSGWEVSASPGGLATALRAVAGQRPFVWVGWPGAPVPADDRAEVTRRLEEEGGGVPVFLERKEVQGWYEELSNRVLWPLFHAMPPAIKVASGAWQRYVDVNQRFADAIAERARPGDTIWVHDYQLALVPQMLRQRELDCAIGFFLHIPFPASETFRTLPVREEILRGILGSNFIGFHAYEYISHFRSSILRILGVESDPEHLVLPTHHVRMGALPIGIEPEEIEEIAARPEIAAEYAELRERYRGRKVILGVDRLDYTKGLPQKLVAFEELLEKHPELAEKVVFIQIASPSRMGVAEYQKLKREIDELVGRISGRFGTLSGSPLVYMHQHVPREQLVPLYQLADIALVTPLRDGMNLVCLEYVAARGEKPGTLILSEFAGAAQCLSGAVLVNPYHTGQIARALADALSEEGDSTEEVSSHMREFVYDNTSAVWAARFLERLEATWREFGGRVKRLRARDPRVAERVRRSQRPLLLLDYDGTLQPHMRLPSQAAPSERVRAFLRDAQRLARTYVVSGRSRAVLDQWIGDLGVGMVCEHGLAVRHPGAEWPEPPHLDTRVLEEIVHPLFRDFCDRTPGSRIEKKAASLAWHHRGSDPKLGAWRVNELLNQLEGRLSGQSYSVLMGARVVEVRHVTMTKAAAVSDILAANSDCDFVLCAGNDRTGEDMFQAVAGSRLPSAVIYVGGLNTSAEFFVETPEELLDRLDEMLALWRSRRSQACASEPDRDVLGA